MRCVCVYVYVCVYVKVNIFDFDTFWLRYTVHTVHVWSTCLVVSVCLGVGCFCKDCGREGEIPNARWLVFASSEVGAEWRRNVERGLT